MTFSEDKEMSFCGSCSGPSLESTCLSGRTTGRQGTPSVEPSSSGSLLGARPGGFWLGDVAFVLCTGHLSEPSQPSAEGLIALGLQMQKRMLANPLRPARGLLACVRAMGFKLLFLPEPASLGVSFLGSLWAVSHRQGAPAGAKPWGYRIPPAFCGTCRSVGLDFCHPCFLPQLSGISFSRLLTKQPGHPH